MLSANSSKSGSKADWLWLGLMLYVGFIALYFVYRYNGNWAENDSAVFSQASRAIIKEGRLITEQSETYPNGYVFQATSAFINAVTGLDITRLQQLIYPLTAVLLVLPAYALYREFTGSARGAMFASLLLFTQPEFLFVILRSSHEKFTRALLLLCLFWLVRSFKLRHRPWLFAAHVGLFYLTAYALIASNNLLGNSFIFAVGAALALGWFLRKWRNYLQPQGSPIVKRLLYVTATCVGLVYLFTFYTYTPAQHDLLVLQNIWQKIAALLLDVQKTKNAYNQVSEGWISLPIYLTLSIANWLLLGASFVIWGRQMYRWLWKREVPQSSAAWLLGLLYAAFALQGAASVVVDASGSFGNLQHRIFPSFSIVAAAVAGGALGRWRPRRLGRVVQVGFSLSIFLLAIFSILKATNEPLLSNKWTFYRPEEITALRWSDAHLKNTEIWTEFDERLIAAFATVQNQSLNHNVLVNDKIQTATHNILVTELTKLRGSRLQRALPVPPDALLIYDNGEAELYRVRARTPFQ